MKAPEDYGESRDHRLPRNATCSKAIEIAKAQITNRMDQLSSFGDG